MKEAFSKLFWGFLFILIEIHFIWIDILADPIGYFLIYLGLAKLTEMFKIQNFSRVLAILLIVISLPTVFMDQTKNNGSSMSGMIEWSMYEQALGLAKLVLTYFVLKVMLEVAKQIGNNDLQGVTLKFFKIYMPTMVIISFVQPFLMNMHSKMQIGVTLFSAIVSLILNIIFLVILRKFRKSEWLEKEPVKSREELGQA
ncbi:hypothetical protein [Pseudalkalibacillus berkeleyi]|uniref:Uncharacterized protein n=1 Tax=Pseudalkalibacillus berkeleyi TaxID=1069813 RepID=A0ABS9GU74_9BACL|nr:hypothetical protein [Pseudalkalibacillus berkeleyi]MCF6136393.1 hypothetical protein [Pseudalkalibacillus berkeleyi]